LRRRQAAAACGRSYSSDEGSDSTNLIFALGERIAGKNMENLKFDKEIAALLVIDPYNDFIFEGGKLWDCLKTVAEAIDRVPHMLQVLDAARKA
jgi:hypothetical protein